MCTISWLVTEGELHVRFNRDETRLREIAAPPQVWDCELGSFIAPLDKRGGGTWLAATSDGIVYALLNNYDAVSKVKSTGSSRGIIPYRLASGAWKLADLLEDPSEIAGVAPFHLMVIDAKGISHHTWDGTAWELRQCEPQFGCFTTSSWNSGDVSDSRLSAFDKFSTGGRIPTNDDLKRFHDGLETPEDPAASVLMDRPETRTVSQTQVCIRDKKVSVKYRDRDLEGKGFYPYSEEISLMGRRNS